MGYEGIGEGDNPPFPIPVLPVLFPSVFLFSSPESAGLGRSACTVSGQGGQTLLEKIRRETPNIF